MLLHLGVGAMCTRPVLSAHVYIGGGSIPFGLQQVWVDLGM